MSKLISNILSAFLLVTVTIASDDKDTICPISGGMIKGSTVKAKYKDGNISFCSESCKVNFSKNTKKYSALGNYQLVSTGQYVQTNCPVTGRKLKKKSKKPKIVQINKQDVELCCGGCMKKASKMADAEKFEFLFSDESLKKGYKLASK